MIPPRPFARQWRRLGQLGDALHGRLLPPVLEPGSMPYFSLVYLLFLAMPFFLGASDRAEAIPSLIAALVFLPLYFGFYWARGWQRLALLVLIAAMAVPMLRYNWFSSMFLIYSNVLAVFLPVGQMLAVIVIGQALWALAVYLEGLPMAFVVFMGLFTGLLSALGNWVWVSNARKNAALRLSQDEVRRLAVVAERERIGRDLHDLLGHTLSVVALKSELAAKLLDRDPTAALREIGEVGQVAREALAQVRSAVTGIRRMLLAGELANARLALGAARVDFHYSGSHPPLPQDIETVLALVLREAVTNVMRHARANRCTAHIEIEGTRLQFLVEDDGVGLREAEGQGLRGMRERVEALGGTLTIEAGANGGARVRVILPVPEPEDEALRGALPFDGAPRPA